MKEFGWKDNITDKDFMIHILNNLSKDYDVILDGLENYLTAIGDHALTINMICEKLHHLYKKVKCKKKKNWKKALRAYNKQCKQRCHKCSKYSHKPGNQKCPENKNEKEEKCEKT